VPEVQERLQAHVADRYAIEREIGRGGMATVYVARDLRHGRLVALKVFRPELANLIGRERFLREIEIAARLIHPNILPLYDSGEAGDLLYYVMPYVAGETLRSRLARERQLSIPDAIQIAREVADALSHAHRQGIVHRDIKPENILLEDTHAVVADFGIARALSTAGGLQLTSVGLVLGTPSYMSPEQAAGDELIDYRSDLYSLGCVLYEMLAGAPPFTGHAVKARHIADSPPSLRALRASVSEELEGVVEQALAKVPADRFASAVEFARALTGAAPREPIKRGRLRRSSIRVALPLGVLGVLILLARDRLTRSPNVSHSGAGVVVLPFEYESADRSTTAGGDAAVHHRFAEALEGLPQIRAIDGGGLIGANRSWRAMPFADLLRHAQRLHGRYLVTGVVAMNGVTPHVTVDVYDASNGQRISRNTAEIPHGGVRVALGRVALAAMRGMVERDTLVTGTQAGLLSTTSSAFALRHLLDGQRKFWRSDFDGAASSFRSAIEEDSTCALAFHRLSVAEIWRHDFPAALVAAEAGLQRSPFPSRWSELLEAQRQYARREGRSAIEAFQMSVQDDPANIDGWLGLGEALFHFGWFAGYAPSDAGTALRRVIALDSTFAPIHHHLIDLALYRGDASEARRRMHAFPPNALQRSSRQAVIALRFGTRTERAEALHRLADADRFTISELVTVLTHGDFDVQLADTVAAYLAGAGRTPDDRVRGAQYRLVTRAALGRWDDGLSAWKLARSGSNLDGWLVQAHFAGYPVRDLVAPMFAAARAELVAGRAPDFTLPPWHEHQQAFLALTHRALLEGDAADARELLRRLELAAPRADPSDPLPGSLRSSLQARLAMLGGDTARAVALLERSVARIPESVTQFFPLTGMAPQRLVLARLLIANGQVTRALPWLDSFRSSWSIADALFTENVRRLRAESARTARQSAYR
jgi:tetratricopeptide (TPR) repeat protein